MDLTSLAWCTGSRRKRLSRRGAGGWDFARNSLHELIPLLSRINSAVIPLLFRCYFPCYFRCCSAVGAANSSRKYLKQHIVLGTGFSQEAAASFFLLVNSGFWIPADPELRRHLNHPSRAQSVVALPRLQPLKRRGGGEDIRIGVAPPYQLHANPQAIAETGRN